jgi:pyruvate-formate lyase
MSKVELYTNMHISIHTYIHTYIHTGISIVADSLSAIKSGKVTPKRDERGITIGFDIQGEGEKFGNDKDEVDGIAKYVVHKFMVCMYVCMYMYVCVCMFLYKIWQ